MPCLHMRLILRKGDVEKLQPGDSFQLKNMMIQQYNMQKYLSLSKDAVVTKVDNIRETETAETESDAWRADCKSAQERNHCRVTC